MITATDRLGNSSTLTLTFSIHPTAKGILAAINDGAARGFMTAAEKTTLVNAINTVIGANRRQRTRSSAASSARCSPRPPRS